jgi:hypothetical protein
MKRGDIMEDHTGMVASHRDPKYGESDTLEAVDLYAEFDGEGELELEQVTISGDTDDGGRLRQVSGDTDDGGPDDTDDGGANDTDDGGPDDTDDGAKPKPLVANDTDDGAKLSRH